jgi:CheY-like chemotaxis protein
LLAIAFEAQGIPLDLQIAGDGEHAMDILREALAGKRCRPDLIVLDLSIPKLSGVEVLSAIRHDPQLQRTPVVVLTSSDSPADLADTEALGISAYLRKPMGLDEFIALGGQLLQMTERPASAAG